MTSAFRVCIIVPQGYPHSQCFTEAGFLLKHSLASLGIECDITFNDLARDRINILLGWHLLQWCDALAGAAYIPYQLEQLSDASWTAFIGAKQEILVHALDVWDYSKENIRFLAGRGIPGRHVPLGYHECLERIPLVAKKDIDVLFYGSSNERRTRVLDYLAHDKDLTIRSLFGVYGKQRDDCIGRSRIILNIHYYDTQILEAVRISYLLNNRCFVVSEQSQVNPYAAVKIPMYQYAELADTCRVFLTDENGMENLAQTTYRQFKENYPMTEFMKEVLVSAQYSL
jgi:hypothetical protein